MCHYCVLYCWFWVRLRNVVWYFSLMKLNITWALSLVIVKWRSFWNRLHAHAHSHLPISSRTNQFLWNVKQQMELFHFRCVECYFDSCLDGSLAAAVLYITVVREWLVPCFESRTQSKKPEIALCRTHSSKNAHTLHDDDDVFLTSFPPIVVCGLFTRKQ